MSFQHIGQKLNIEEIKQLGKLDDEQISVKAGRDKELFDIITGRDKRLLLIIGPCSSDNETAVLEYAHRLSKLQAEVADEIFMMMRVYTAKPRTNGDGYKGIIHQSNPNSEQNLINGIKAVRELHYRVIAETGLTTADEMLYVENLNLVDDLVSYIAVGARSVENQVHRFVSSGIDTPVGMKNPTSGNLNVMFNAIHAAQKPQTFLYDHEEVHTTGNPLAHAILRGGIDEYGVNHPNYYMDNLLSAIESYEKLKLENPFIIVDTNHDNSGKQYMEQIRIVDQILMNRKWNSKVRQYVRGFMIESYLEDGRQDEPIIFGKSITDPCLGWDKTEALVQEIHKRLKSESQAD
ncbi:MAG: 3-deoxy-7-phosphoheptulonate synthase [Streptococcaceae bacterium]|jgi:3-deoxy-7-phosphoheptulonate synthase|nr:3-deoxy-7-phosphoheptulonate synthase [Streptococcaceae bacterium]